MTALSANTDIGHMTAKELREFPVAAAEHIYRGGFVGVDPGGYSKAFVPGDLLVGIAYEEVDNSAGAAAADKSRVYADGDFVIPISGVALTDVGKPVFATDDGAGLLTGHTDAFIGTILHYYASGEAVVRLKAPGQKPPNGIGSYESGLTGFEYFAATGDTAGDAIIGGDWEMETILGPGIIGPTAGENGGHTLAFDATDETALASCRTMAAMWPVDKGITFEVELHLTDIGDDELDVDWGLGTFLDTDTEANIDHSSMVDLACFHLDGLAAHILAQSDDQTTDVAPVDTTIDNALNAAKKFKIIVRPDGTVEFWIAGARVLSTTAFAVLSTATLGAFINMEKVTDAGACSLIFWNLRVAGGCRG